MKNYLFLIVIFVLFSCEKDTEFKDINMYYKYHIELDDADRTSHYLKTYENDVIIESGDYIYKEDTIVFNKCNSHKLLFEKTVYILGEEGVAINSIDTIYGESMVVMRRAYTYEDNYLSETRNTTYYYKNYLPVDSTKYTSMNEYSGENLTKTDFWYIGAHCWDLCSKWQKNPNAEDIGILGKAGNFVKFKTVSMGCPCGPSSVFATQEFQYILNEDNRIEKIIETKTGCYHIGSTIIPREITTSTFEYFRR